MTTTHSVDLQQAIEKRRTFAIISHPDAGKTTLTEKLLLYGGAIHLAGAVKAKANQRKTTSDWMEIEKERGISISASVLQFEYNGYHINLLDTPGHRDFSEDTYRTLTAADAAIMLMDAAKGVEPQTRKLFEVCRMRGIPIFTFINKMDRPAQDPLDLLDEVEKVLGIRSCPVTWPIGMGDRFRGIYDRQTQEFLTYQTEGEANVKGRIAPQDLSGLNRNEVIELLAGPYRYLNEGEELFEKLQSDRELLEIAGDPYDAERVLAGELTPVFFGSAMNNFGVERFLSHFLEMSPQPTGRKTIRQKQKEATTISPARNEFSAFVFKIQANMDPQHRDRVAFIRICSGQFTRNMKVKHTRTGRSLRLSRPLHFFAQERVVVEEAWPGDIVGVVDTTGLMRIGDTLTEKSSIQYQRVPQFSPEHFATVELLDPMKRKQLKKGLDQLTEEGVIQIYYEKDKGEQGAILGAVGQLQLDVLVHRLKAEYGVEAKLNHLPYSLARWVQADDLNPRYFIQRDDTHYVQDRDNQPVLLFKNEWSLRWTQEKHPEFRFFSTTQELEAQ